VSYSFSNLARLERVCVDQLSNRAANFVGVDDSPEVAAISCVSACSIDVAAARPPFDAGEFPG
jgi:hypothetical protein